MTTGMIDTNALCGAISKAIVEGNGPLVTALTKRSDSNHDLRDHVQTNTDKLYALDTEIKLLKGVIVSLNGSGDGSSGSVPRLEAGMTALRSEVSGLRGDVTGIKEAVENLTRGAADQKSWTDGWRGIGAAISIIAAGLGILGTCITAMIWLVSHGVKP